MALITIDSSISKDWRRKEKNLNLTPGALCGIIANTPVSELEWYPNEYSINNI